VEIIKRLNSSKKLEPLNSLIFHFERSIEAANHNAEILERYNFDLDAILLSYPHSQISYGSEFKKSSDLQELLQDHPHWDHLKEILDNGATFPLNQISSEERQKDV
jgi:hypothetical protein